MAENEQMPTEEIAQESKQEQAVPAKKRSFAPWMILGIIALAAALVLGLTNLITEGPITERKQKELEAAFSNVQPEGTLESVPDQDNLAVIKTDGQVAGYAVKTSATGYGGDVTVVLGLNAEGEVIGAQIGDGGFQETSGIGARWLNADKAADLLGMSALEGGLIDVLSGATVTSTAVLNASNEGMAKVAALMGKDWGEGKPVAFVKEGDEDVSIDFVEVASSGTSMTVKNSAYAAAPAQEETAWQPGAKLEGRAVGTSTTFEGGEVIARIALDENAKIKTLEVDASTQTPGFGQNCATPEFTDRFIGKSAPLVLGEDVDALSGATVTSKAVVEAINAAEAMSPWQPGGKLEGKAAGFENGEVVIRMTLDENAKIKTLEVDASTQTPGIGQRCEGADFTDRFVGKAAPLKLKEDIDALSGATVTSEAVVKAVNSAYALDDDSVKMAAGQFTTATRSGEGVAYTTFAGDYSGKVTVTYEVKNGVAEAVTIDSEEEPPLVRIDDQGRYVTSFEGYGGQPVTIFATLDENGAIATFEVDVSTQTDGFGQRCDDPEWLSQFIGKKDKVQMGNGVEALSGATETSKAIVKAFNQFYKNLPANEPEPAAAAAPAEEAPLVSVDEQGRYVTSYAGYDGKPVTLCVTLDDAGAIAAIEVDVSTQTPGIGQRCDDAEWLSQFIGKKDKVQLGNGVEALSGATETSKAIVRGINQLFKNLPAEGVKAEPAAPAEEAPLVSVDDQGRYVTSYAGYDGKPVTLCVTLDDAGAIAAIEVDVSTQTPGIGQRCNDAEWLSQFIGKKDKVTLGNGVDALSGATETSKAIVRGINQLFKNLPAK